MNVAAVQICNASAVNVAAVNDGILQVNLLLSDCSRRCEPTVPGMYCLLLLTLLLFM